METNHPLRLQVENFGPIQQADVTFGDLTVLVGPQASGKSILLQLLKLLVDKGAVQSQLSRYGVDWQKEGSKFLQAYFGEGMQSLGTKHSEIVWNGGKVTFDNLANRGKANTKETMFYVPAQRVMAFHATSGWFRGWADFGPGDPFVVRHFGQKLFELAQKEFGTEEPIFPAPGRLNTGIGERLEGMIFGGFSLRHEHLGLQRRLVLRRDTDSPSLPLTVWSAGQREFVPLLLGAYHLLPPDGRARQQPYRWAVLEEPEMGLHPRGIGAVMLLVLDLLHRGYRVAVSSHSAQLLEAVWALRLLKTNQATPADVCALFDVSADSSLGEVAASALKKSMRVYYCARHETVREISNLDPAAEDAVESEWGGLSEFSSRANNAVAAAVNARELREALKK